MGTMLAGRKYFQTFTRALEFPQIESDIQLHLCPLYLVLEQKPAVGDCERLKVRSFVLRTQSHQRFSL